MNHISFASYTNRGNNCNSWLNMLQNLCIVESSFVCVCSSQSQHSKSGLNMRFIYHLIWTRVALSQNRTDTFKERRNGFMNDKYPPLTLKAAAVMDFLPAVTQCVETAAGYYGLGTNETLKLRLAAEEIFSYLCQRVCRGNPVDVICQSGLFFARVAFHFSVSALDMGALNMTTSVSFDGDEDMAQMGLVIAARTVDRLFLSAGTQNAVTLTIEQDNAYPAVDRVEVKTIEAKGELAVLPPNEEDLRRFALQAAMCARDPHRPDFFAYPGKVADMVASGSYQAVVAKDEAQTIAGGLLYRALTEKIVEVFSPCVFDPSREERISTMLMEACMVRTARTKAVGLVSLTGLPDSLRRQFEPLGDMVDARDGKGGWMSRAYCRLLHEDPGGQVWTHPSLRSFLEKEYHRLFLARDIREVQEWGEASRVGPSIFSTEIHRGKSEAFLRPLWPGRDFPENVARHVALCKKESLQNIFFSVDLGVSWHAHLAPVLMKSEFKPRMIIPFAGQADLVFFQYDESES